MPTGELCPHRRNQDHGRYWGAIGDLPTSDCSPIPNRTPTRCRIEENSAGAHLRMITANVFESIRCCRATPTCGFSVAGDPAVPPFDLLSSPRLEQEVTPLRPGCLCRQSF
ncbi:hypothetical protein PG999_014324 [Apiospora kogelbergensis]|uniref:Uncharacterized protein n=1 Tax=Apiospora kogelbergensis TaxID=1337665 RepID=A0AAW0Q300_9PEZI